MKNKIAITGTVLLEAFWASRKKDMLDLITPFIQYGISKTTAIGSSIDISKVTSIMREDFGYTDIPESVVIKVIHRDKEHFHKKDRKYFLDKNLDKQAERIEQRKIECLTKIDVIGESLYKYLCMHCRKNKILSRDQCVNFLQQFFSLFALQIGFETLETEKISQKNDEINYYIAQYIFENKTEKSKEYSIIIDLTKGYLLRSAIYLQFDNPDISSASYKNTAIYYDTPFLLQLLGYQSEEAEEAAQALHRNLKKQGAHFFYFPQNEQELTEILTAYQYSLRGKTRSSKTLEGLDLKNYKFDDVGRLKKKVPSILKDKYGIELREMPEYAVTRLGTVDIQKIDISESEAIEYVRQHTKHYSDDNLASDVASALGIHRLRSGITSQSIEHCKAIFVTTNGDFTKAFNDFYKANIGSNLVMPVITAFDLSAIAWVKSGGINAELPEKQLLINSYQAMQPAPEILECCRTVLTKLENEGKISEEEAISLRADRVTQRELWIEYFPSIENIDENYIEKLQEKQRKRLVGEKEVEIIDKFNRKKEDEKAKQIQDAKAQAKKYAAEKKNRYRRKLICIVTVIFVIIAFFCVIGLISSLQSVKINISLIAFLAVSILSIIDTLNSRSKIIGKIIEKKSNYYETKEYEKKQKEYMSLFQ